MTIHIGWNKQKIICSRCCLPSLNCQWGDILTHAPNVTCGFTNSSFISLFCSFSLLSSASLCRRPVCEDVSTLHFITASQTNNYKGLLLCVCAFQVKTGSGWTTLCQQNKNSKTEIPSNFIRQHLCTLYDLWCRPCVSKVLLFVFRRQKGEKKVK